MPRKLFAAKPGLLIEPYGTGYAVMRAGYDDDGKRELLAVVPTEQEATAYVEFLREPACCRSEPGRGPLLG